MAAIAKGATLSAVGMVLIVLFIQRSWNKDRISALLFLPYLAWVSFATLLNLSLFILN